MGVWSDFCSLAMEGFAMWQAEWTPGPGIMAAKLKTMPPKGQLLSLVAIAEHSDAGVVGNFASSSEMLNRIHQLIVGRCTTTR
jgi:hypothetical protein